MLARGRLTLRNSFERSQREALRPWVRRDRTPTSLADGIATVSTLPCGLTPRELANGVESSIASPCVIPRLDNTMTTLARALFAICALQYVGCSSDGAEPSSDEGSGAAVDVKRATDAGMVMPRSTDADSSVATRPSSDGSAKRDAGAGSSNGRLDASTGDAGSQSDATDATDASQAHDASADSSVNTTAKASAGCGKSGKPSGGRVSVAGAHNYTFPATYDGKQPFPLLLGFHAASNPIDQIENLTKGSDFETNYVRAFPKSKGSAWDYATDIGAVLAMYDDLMANYCIDANRVFATGHSSGAQLIAQILTPGHKTDADHFQLKAVAPVAASRYGTVSRAIPVMYIQGQHDMVRNSDGSDVVKEFATANGCMMASQPYTSVPSCMSSGKTVKDGCIQYEGCNVPTVWCSHDDPQYSNTSHGWPCFATKSIYDFFAALP